MIGRVPAPSPTAGASVSASPTAGAPASPHAGASALESPLADAVASAFGAAGPLARADAHHVERDVQVRMALAVAEAIEQRSALVVEAGTGVGKTYA